MKGYGIINQVYNAHNEIRFLEICFYVFMKGIINHYFNETFLRQCQT